MDTIEILSKHFGFDKEEAKEVLSKHEKEAAKEPTAMNGFQAFCLACGSFYNLSAAEAEKVAKVRWNDELTIGGHAHWDTVARKYPTAERLLEKLTKVRREILDAKKQPSTVWADYSVKAPSWSGSACTHVGQCSCGS